jgi:hypothetical protein
VNPRQTGALTGILFVVLIIIAFIVGGNTPDVNDSPRDIVSFYIDNDTEQQVGAALVALGCVAFVFFLGTLRQSLRAAAGDEGGLSTVALLGGLMIVVGASIFAGLTFTLGDAADDMPASATVALNALNSDLFFPIAVGTAAFNIGLGLGVLRHGGLPRWLGWVALVIGIAGLTPAGFFAFLATGIVIVAASVVLFQQAGEAEPRPAPAA